MSTAMLLTNEAFRLSLKYSAPQPPELTHLCAARRDTAAFQIIVNSDMRHTVSIATHDSYSAYNHLAKNMMRTRLCVDAPFPVTLRLEGFLPDNEDIPVADILLTQDTVESQAGMPNAVWAEIAVPEDAPAGDYTVTVKLYGSRYNEDEALLSEQTVSLRVMPYTLPEPKDWSFHLDLWQHNCNIARKHDVPLWSDEHFAVIEKYVKTLADLGQKSITVCASDIPWRGQGCFADHRFGGDLFEYSIIEIERDEDGTFIYDFSKMQRYIDMCTEAGISGDIEMFGLVNLWSVGSKFGSLCEEYPEAIRLRYRDRADGCMKYMREYGQFCDYVRAIEKYFIDTEQINRLRVAADEPGDVDKYRTSMTLIHELAPAFRYKTAINHAEFIGEFGEVIDDFAPYLRCVLWEHDRLMSYKKEMADKRFLWYVCGSTARPNTSLMVAPIESRAIGWMTAHFRLDGFLRWNYTVWSDNPRKDVRYGVFGAGDNEFVYPAYNGKVLLSLRYKNLQRGNADFELLSRVRAACGDTVADALIDRIIRIGNSEEYAANVHGTDVDRFSMDWNEYNEVKEEMLSLLANT